MTADFFNLAGEKHFSVKGTFRGGRLEMDPAAFALTDSDETEVGE